MTEKICVIDRSLSPNEQYACESYWKIRVLREGVHGLIQVVIVILGGWVMSRPPALGSSNFHPSAGSLVVSGSMLVIEGFSMLSAILTERLRTNLIYLEKRGLIVLYSEPHDRRHSQFPYDGDNRRGHGHSDIFTHTARIYPLQNKESPPYGYSQGPQTQEVHSR